MAVTMGDGMAVVSEFEQIRTERAQRHPTSVRCEWQVISDPRGMLLQLDTLGSSKRQIHDKVSQTIQFDREAAIRLVAIVREAFPDVD